MTERRLHLGTFLAGVSAGHWRDPGVESNVTVNIDALRRYATIAEDAKFDLGFIADNPAIQADSSWPLLSRLEPITALSALATHTTNLGLVGTISTSLSYPFDVARQLLSLDVISKGRVGWNVVTSGGLSGALRNFGHEKPPGHDEGYDLAEEHLDIVRGLWNSWGDGAFVRNKETGQYIDPDKLYPLRHEGGRFGPVDGPLNLERSPQGHPVIFQAGASPRGKRFAAKHADGVFAIEPNDFDIAQQDYRELKALVAEQERSHESVVLFRSFSPVVGVTREDAEAQYERTYRFHDLEYALREVARNFNYRDLHPYVDGPFPDGFEEGLDNSQATRIMAMSRRENLTVGETVLRVARPSKEFVGSAVEIADKIERLFTSEVLDGLMLVVSEENLRRFANLVVPILQERGLHRREYDSTTLRGHLGAPFPVNPNEYPMPAASAARAAG
jgi:FMN-dependent oxidoreductase (nitrilotriacetate monooxygenase family)